MKHVKYNLYQNTNTVVPIETNFFEHNQEHFLFFFRKDDFSAMQRVVLVSQRLVLLLEESSPCLPLRRAEWGFLLNLPSTGRQTLLVKREYQCPVSKQRLHPVGHFPSRIQHRPDQQQTPDTRLCPILCTYAWNYFVPFFVFLAGWGQL